VPESNKTRRKQAAGLPDVHADANVISAFAEGMLRGAERDKVLSHLAACDVCRRVAFLAQMTDRDTSFDAQHFGTSTQSVRMHLWKFTGIAASVACVIGLALSSTYGPERTPPHGQQAAATNIQARLEPVDSMAAAGERRHGQRIAVVGRVANRRPASAVWMQRSVLFNQKLVALPEPLPDLHVLKAPGLSKILGRAPGTSRSNGMFGGVELANTYQPLKAVPTLSIGNVPVRKWKPTCDSTGNCTALYQKDTFQQLALRFPIQWPSFRGLSHDQH
jgi:hypothetical protein